MHKTPFRIWAAGRLTFLFLSCNPDENLTIWIMQYHAIYKGPPSTHS
jgi:hypothetical protein